MCGQIDCTLIPISFIRQYCTILYLFCTDLLHAAGFVEKQNEARFTFSDKNVSGVCSRKTDVDVVDGHYGVAMQLCAVAY